MQVNMSWDEFTAMSDELKNAKARLLELEACNAQLQEENQRLCSPEFKAYLLEFKKAFEEAQKLPLFTLMGFPKFDTSKI